MMPRRQCSKYGCRQVMSPGNSESSTADSARWLVFSVTGHRLESLHERGFGLHTISSYQYELAQFQDFRTSSHLQ